MFILLYLKQNQTWYFFQRESSAEVELTITGLELNDKISDKLCHLTLCILMSNY